jgi:squalene-hopene/tetraprenyl-beta-curcumene cyclase
VSLRTLLLLSLTLACTAQAIGQDTRGTADALVRQIRTFQASDGSYGGDLETTCRVLDALGRSPRRYTDLDGPFVRRAADQVLEGRDVLQDDARLVLALAGCLAAPLSEARAEALARVLEQEGPADLQQLLVFATFAPERQMPPARDERDPALACLVAEDPGRVPPPPTDDVRAWTAWARAARLRGLVPELRPELPTPGPDASLDELIAALETVIVLHGLPSDAGGDAPEDAGELPQHVSAGQDLRPALERAADFLEAHQQGGTFGLELPGWSGPEPGVTALSLAAACWVHQELGRDRPTWIDTGLDYLVGLQKDDGAIAAHGLDVYTTTVAIEALLAAGREGDSAVIERARAYLVAAQSDEGEGYSLEDDPHYGGIGYGGDERPDLSNTQMALGALAAAGTAHDAQVFRKALVFLERCQNLGERVVHDWPRQGGGRVVSGVDGGAVYMPGNSPAGEDAIGPDTYAARSYGSMTYGLVKSYLFCNVPPTDPRVRAAVAWLGAHFSVDHNPGFEDEAEGAQGLYYYYLAMARTLEMLPPDGLKDAEGNTIPWQETLRRKLLDEQRVDGSWINARSPRWWEGAPTLCTAYALLALESITTSS